MEPGPLACSDAERRSARALAAALRARGRRCTTDGRWVRPGWPWVQALCATVGVAAGVVGVSHPLTGTILAGAALLVSLLHGRGRLPLGRARATQDVLAPAPSPAPVTLVVLAALDRPRATLLARVPAPLVWLAGALALQTAGTGARLAGVEGTLLGAAQILPSTVLLLVAGLLADAAVARPGHADNAATDAAVAVALAATWADVVLVGASEIGRRRRVRADRRPPESVVLMWLEPTARLSWRTAHPTLAALMGGLGDDEAHLAAERRRGGSGLPAGSRPAITLAGPPGALTELALAFAARLKRQLDAGVSSEK
ncbi:MAG: hypothetical protein ABI950_10115 [Solirubrobacteraceae bacterium]